MDLVKNNYFQYVFFNILNGILIIVCNIIFLKKNRNVSDLHWFIDTSNIKLQRFV